MVSIIMATRMNRAVITKSSSIANMTLHPTMRTVNPTFIMPACPACKEVRNVGKIGTKMFFCSECIKTFKSI